jgi:hypothetical protein
MIQELDEFDNKIGENYHSSDHEIKFILKNIQHNLIQYSKNVSEKCENQSDCHIKAILIPINSEDLPIQLSYIGKKDFLKFYLKVQKSTENRCHIQYKNDFDDDLEISIQILPNQFDELLNSLNSFNNLNIYLNINKLDGLYFKRNPISYSEQYLFKLLDNKFREFDNQTENKPLTIGNIDNFEIRLCQHYYKIEDAIYHFGGRTDWVKIKLNDLLNAVIDKYDLKINNLDGNKNISDLFESSMKYKIYQDILPQIYDHYISDKTNNNIEYYEAITYKLVDDIEQCFTPYMDYFKNPEDQFNYLKRCWQLWSHKKLDARHLTVHDDDSYYPYIDIDNLCVTINRYLNFPVKFKIIDKLFVDALVAFELYAYARELYYLPSKILPDFTKNPLQKKHPLWRFIRSTFIKLFSIIFLPTSIAFSVSIFIPYNFNILIIIFGLSVLIWMINLVWSVIHLPKIWVSETHWKKWAIKLLGLIDGVYLNINESPISPTHIKDLSSYAAKRGVGWRSILFVLLDDIIDRKSTL